MPLAPASLFRRVLLTLLLSFGSFAIVTFATILQYALIPVVQRSTADLAAFTELSARTLVLLPQPARELYRKRLFEEFQLRLATGDDAPQGLNDGFFPYAMRLSQAFGERFGRRVPMQSNLIDGKRWFWVALDTSAGTVWAGIPRDRIGTRPLTGLVVIAVLAVLLLVFTAALLARRVTAPLTRLSRAAEEVAEGRSPEPLPERGPRELADLARQFNALNRQIQTLLADRTLLLAGISHDLRTPLTRLRLALEMLPGDADPDRVARMAQDIEEMSVLIGHTLELGRTLGAGESRNEDIVRLISDLVGCRSRLLWRPLGECRHPVNGLALRRILGNLIENALRYSDAVVEVRLDCRGRRPAVFVLDRGPGIPEAEREAVFRPFYRLEQSRNRRTGGSGLGLAVARQLAVANGMEVYLSAREGGGTVAGVWLRPASA